MDKRYIQETKILDFSHPDIINLVDEKGWKKQNTYEKIGAIYAYIQNEILFGYNEADNIPASKVLHNGYGQCNTKGSLLLALLRCVGVPCRFHGFTIDNEMQKGAISKFWLKKADSNIIHSWVEVFYKNEWINLEGYILDHDYLLAVQSMFPHATGPFIGYGIGVTDFRHPAIEWNGKDTYIQKEGINHDYGVYDSPDDFYHQHGVNLSGLKSLIYKYLVRHLINKNVIKIRNQKS